MKKQFVKSIGEVRRLINELLFFETIVNTVLFFLALYFLFTLVNVRGMYAMIPAIVYFFVDAVAKFRSNKARMVEKKHSALNEKFRTAVDTIGEDNLIVEELEFEVMKEMKNVSLSQFFNARSVSFKALAITLLAFGIIFSSTLNIHLIDLGAIGEDGEGRKISKGAGDFEAVELKPDDDIYGEEDVAKLGDDELDIKIKPVDFKISVKEEGDLETGRFNDIFPSEVDVQESEESQENIPKEQQELVKNYFKNLAES